MRVGTEYDTHIAVEASAAAAYAAALATFSAELAAANHSLDRATRFAAPPGSSTRGAGLRTFTGITPHCRSGMRASRPAITRPGTINKRQSASRMPNHGDQATSWPVPRAPSNVIGCSGTFSGLGNGVTYLSPCVEVSARIVRGLGASVGLDSALRGRSIAAANQIKVALSYQW